MAGSATAVPLAWSCTFPATPAQVREARRFLAGILAGHPAADDATLCMSELASNTAIHSRSRNPGGHFVVRVRVNEPGRIRVEVQDEGGPWTRDRRQDGHQDGQHGRGLLIVSQLADAWGRSGDSAAGWIVWFEIDWPMTARHLAGHQRCPSTTP